MVALLARLVTFILPAVKWAWPHVRALGIWAAIFGVHVAVAKSLWESLFSKLDQIATGYVPPTVSFQPFGLANRFFPLSELLTMVGGYAILKAATAGVRITKAFIDARKT